MSPLPYILASLLPTLVFAVSGGLGDGDLSILATRISLAQLPPPSTLSAFDAALTLNLSYVLVDNYTFSDIDYTYCVNANWPAMLHPERTLSFAAAYASPRSKYYNNSGLLSTVHGLLGSWLAFNSHHSSTNWWMNDVGVPGFVGRLGLVLQYLGSLTQQEEAGILNATHRADYYRGGCEPTNCLWLAGNVFLGAVLTRNASLANRTSQDIFATINTRNPFAPSDPSGIKGDGSFMMHGSLLYSGGYGMCYAQGLINLLAWTANTTYALPPGDPRWDTLSHFLLDGSLRMIKYGTPLPPYGPGAWDVSALGRNYARPYGHDPGSAAGQAVTIPVDSLGGVGGPRGGEFRYFASLLNGTGAQDGVPPAFLAFSNHFYQADYTMHTAPILAQAPPPSSPSPQLPSWTSSAFSASNRTRRSEITNAEGEASWHFAENAMWTMVNGSEFLDVWPAIDLQKIPGTTVLPYHVYGDGDVGGMGVNGFVGGASNGRGASVASNDFVAPNKVGLAYRKTTAFFPSAVVQLSANITAAVGAPGDPLAKVFTTLEQRRAGGGGACVGQGSTAPPPSPSLQGLFTSAEGATSPLPPSINTSLPDSVWWVWEGGVGYLLLDRIPSTVKAPPTTTTTTTTTTLSPPLLPTLHVSHMVQNGTWAKVGVWSDWVACNVFTLWVEHPIPVVGGSFAYAVAPGVGLQEWAGGGAAGLAGDLGVLSNTPELQVVVEWGVGVVAATAFMGGGVGVESGGEGGLALNFSSPGAYLVTKGGGGVGGLLELAAAQPAQGFPWSTVVGVSWAGRGGIGGKAMGANCSKGPSGEVVFTLPYPPINGSTVISPCNTATVGTG